MQPFDQDESGFTATAKSVQFSANDNYNLTILDNPVRKKTNYALIQANRQAYQTRVAL